MNALDKQITKDDIQTFIFVHEQDIVAFYEKINKFKEIKDYKYVFLGNKNVDNIRDLENVIIARELENNLEEYPKMCAYSGWYVLFKNNIVTKDYVNLFEYDVILHDEFNDKMIDIINEDQNISFYGFKPFNVNSCFLDNSNLNGKLEEYYSNLRRKINNKCLSRNIFLWSTTSNCTMKNEFFYNYMKDNEDIFMWMKDKPSVGHELERNLSIYQILNDEIEVLYVTGILTHFQLDSHKTQGVFNENYIQNLKKMNDELYKF